MKTYLVGGAVRDKLLQLPVTERDWVVVGMTAEQLLAAGYQQLDPEFPVFLHPETREEYALARHETKIGEGYRGFHIEANPHITLQQDLARRDLTINAIAQDEDGTLIDPFNGQDDLRNGYLRHITPAFCEDPVRILRIARMAAKLGHYFRIVHATQRLLRQMVDDGAAQELAHARTVQEMRKTLAYQQPWHFFKVLQTCGALETIWPQLAKRMCNPPTHSEGELSVPLQALQRACRITEQTSVRFVALALQATPPLTWLQVLPNRYRDLLGSAMQAWQQLPSLDQANAQQVYEFLHQHQAWRNTQHFQQLIWVLQAQNQHIALLHRLQQAQEVTEQVDAAALATQGGLQGEAIGQALAAQRQAAIKAVWA